MGDHRVVRIAASATVDEFDRALAGGRHVIVHDPSRTIDDTVQLLLVDALDRAGVGSASPIPSKAYTPIGTYPLHQALPPPPTIALPCRSLTAFSASALASMPASSAPTAAGTVGERVVEVGEHLVRHGWRHVAVPGVALHWAADDATTITPNAGWTAAFVASQVGDANVSLEAHVSWADAQRGGAVLAIDGVCLTDDPFTGTQHLVVEVARWMAEVRPSWRVLLAVKRGQVASVTERLTGSTVEVVERSTDLDADVVYRPYQMLYARELPFVMSVGRRGLVGQLDMIGFANPFYHPSDRLAFFARNLQRFMMRSLDGVTFISEFGRESAFAECPDLDPRRLHVVSCGADPQPPTSRTSTAPNGFDAEDGFLVSLSSTFWHKNRTHAIATFAHLVEHHGYAGDLVIGGPEPYFGRSTATEEELLATLPNHVRARVHRWGHVSDEHKWWLLEHADVALYPSIVEGFGLVPFEAAAVGTPCLAHAGTAPGELLAGTDALVASWEPAVWAERAAELIADRDRAAAVTAEVAAVTVTHTWRCCAERTWSAVDTALASPRRLMHGDDGSSLTRIARDPGRRAIGGALRFDVARGLPAVKRRIVRSANRAKGRS